MIKSILIAAVDVKTGGIGLNGGLPWPNITDDKMFFKKTTCAYTGSFLVCGTRTAQNFDHIDLAGRRLSIVSGKRGFLETIESNNKKAQHEMNNPFYCPRNFICGGSRVFAEAVERMDEINLTTAFITFINGKEPYEYDTKMPDIKAITRSENWLKHIVRQGHCNDGATYKIYQYDNITKGNGKYIH